jgi:hypothetical protein
VFFSYFYAVYSIFVSVRFKRYVFHILESILHHTARQGKLFLCVNLCYTVTYVIYCGVVWCGVVWCGVVWCGVILCDVV